jgi:hypothetical protein
MDSVATTASLRPSPRAFTRHHWSVLAAITVIWLGVSWFFAGIFTANYPRYALAGNVAAVLTALAIGLLHLGWLALFRGTHALWGLVIAKLAAIPVTIGAGFFALAMGAMGADSGVENAAREIHLLLPFCMAIAAAPTTLAALLGAVIGWAVGRRARARPIADYPAAPPQ